MTSKWNSKNFQTTFKLDCPASMFLVGSRKNGKAKYIPIELIFVDIANDKIESVALYKQDFFKHLSEITTINDRSSFKHLISIDTQDIFEK